MKVTGSFVSIDSCRAVPKSRAHVRKRAVTARVSASSSRRAALNSRTVSSMRKRVPVSVSITLSKD